MTSTRRLLVNADDFGLSPGVNHGILECFERGVVRNTSLMVHGAAAEEAAALAREHDGLSVGLHVDLAEWEFRGGEWKLVYERVPVSDAAAVAREAAAQIERFVSMVGRPPTHLDSHQHLHSREPLRAIFHAQAATLGVPVRDLTPGIVHRGGFYGQTAEGVPLPHLLRIERILELVDASPDPVIELSCHPAAELDFPSGYARERLRERDVLCDPALLAALRSRGVELSSFAGLARA